MQKFKDGVQDEMAFKMRPTNRCIKEKKKGKRQKDKNKAGDQRTTHNKEKKKNIFGLQRGKRQKDKNKNSRRPKMAIKMRRSTRQVQIEPHTTKKKRKITRQNDQT